MRNRSTGMPSETRYARAADARRSPKARLYSAVPRSSQCPSIVTAQLLYRFSTPALSSRTFLPSGVISLLSSSKNTGFRGEFRFRSSSEADEIASLVTGSGGTGIGSSAGRGGVGVFEPPPDPVAPGGGGICLVTGGTFL